MAHWNKNRAPNQKLVARSAGTVPQKFRYLVVLDFEATCDDNRYFGPQEIIEWPAMIIDTNTNQIIESDNSKFHYYIKPRLMPRLTKFCTKLTGIKQDMVDKGEQVENVLNQWNEFCYKNNLLNTDGKNAQVNSCIVTCGDWDLQQMYPKQEKLILNDYRQNNNQNRNMRRGRNNYNGRNNNNNSNYDYYGDYGNNNGGYNGYNGYNGNNGNNNNGNYRNRNDRYRYYSPALFHSWINIKKAFVHCFNARPKGMMGMLECLNIKHVGRHHSGIDDVLNICNIVIYMLNHQIKLDYTYKPYCDDPNRPYEYLEYETGYFQHYQRIGLQRYAIARQNQAGSNNDNNINNNNNNNNNNYDNNKNNNKKSGDIKKEENKQQDINFNDDAKEKDYNLNLNKTGISCVFVLGPPGAGKTTQCAKIAQKYNHIKHISVGNLLRSAIANQDQNTNENTNTNTNNKNIEVIKQCMKDGTIVPFSISIDLIKKAFQESLEKEGISFFLLDGYPCNKECLDGWNKEMIPFGVNVQGVILLTLGNNDNNDNNNSINIIHQRVQQRKNTGRSDDDLETLTKRINHREKDILPVISSFEKQRLLFRVDATASLDNVFQQVDEIIIGCF